MYGWPMQEEICILKNISIWTFTATGVILQNPSSRSKTIGILVFKIKGYMINQLCGSMS